MRRVSGIFEVSSGRARRLCGRAWWVALLVVAAGLVWPAAAGASTVVEFTGGVTPGFRANVQPRGITTGPDGNIWFTQSNDPGAVSARQRRRDDHRVHRRGDARVQRQHQARPDHDRAGRQHLVHRDRRVLGAALRGGGGAAQRRRVGHRVHRRRDARVQQVRPSHGDHDRAGREHLVPRAGLAGAANDFAGWAGWRGSTATGRSASSRRGSTCRG